MQDHVLAYVVLCRRKEVAWSCVHLEHPFSLYRWCMGEALGLANKCLREHKQEVDGLFVYHECRLPSIKVGFMSDIRLSSFDEAVTAI